VLHVFEASKHDFTGCRRCFLPERHPVHLEVQDGRAGRTE
jgi:hypothetical protein